MSAPNYTPGSNIAMKVPAAAFEATVAFYEKTLGFRIKETTTEGSVVFDFGGKNLWIDCTPGLGQAEIWLDVCTTDLTAAAEHLKSSEVIRCDDIEQLPTGMHAFWIKNPAGIVHLVTES